MSKFKPENPKMNIQIYTAQQKGNAAAAVRRFGLTFATMRWKVMSSSSILSFPFPNFLSAHAQGPKPHSGIRCENPKGEKK